MVKRGCKFRWVLPSFTCFLLRSSVSKERFLVAVLLLDLSKRKIGWEPWLGFWNGFGESHFGMDLENCVCVQKIKLVIWRGEVCHSNWDDVYFRESRCRHDGSSNQFLWNFLGVFAQNCYDRIGSWSVKGGCLKQNLLFIRSTMISENKGNGSKWWQQQF